MSEEQDSPQYISASSDDDEKDQHKNAKIMSVADDVVPLKKLKKFKEE